MSKEATAYISLGSNLGNREKNIKNALDKIARSKHIKLIRTSSIIETTPLADRKQRKYLNCVAEIKTEFAPHKLLQVLKKIEISLGRKKSKIQWSSRIIDLDILLFGRKVICRKDLIIPHTQMHLRSFVLKGLCELDSQLVHPVLKENVSILYSRLNGRDFYLDADKPRLISIAGIIGAGKTTLAQSLKEIFGFRLIKEAYDTNPFLARVYAGQKSLALDSQLYFLLSRCEQLNPANFDLNTVAVSDYIMDKEMIYARIWLDSVQFEMYQKINTAMTQNIVQPAITIYLKLSPQKALERIKQRKRPYEQSIDLNFLERVYNGYEKLFETFSRCPVITVDADAVDFRDSKQVEQFGKKINYYLGLDLKKETKK